MLGRNWYQAKDFIFDWNNQILSRKFLANGIINDVLFRLTISVTNFLDFVLSFDNMSWIVFVHDMNLGLGKLTHNVHVFYTHPKTNLSILMPLQFLI